MKSIKVCEYSRSRTFHYDLILQDQASGERSQDHWSSGFFSCDHNQYSIDYILALSKAKRKFQTDTSVDTGQNEDIDHSETRHSVDTDQSDSEQSDTLRTEYQSEPLSDSESNSSYSMEYT